MASILIADPGQMIYQVGGHAAIRLQCPTYRMDNVFSYETDSEDILTQLLGQANGRFSILTFDKYINRYIKEGRQVTSYHLNLTDSQTHKLLSILDKTVKSDTTDKFNLRHNNCNSNVLAKITEALGNDTIINHNQFLSMTNGALQRHILNDYAPWSAAIFNIGIGSAADDIDPWQTRTVPIILGDFLSDCHILSANGSHRPLLASKPIVISPGIGQSSTTILTPTVVAILLLFFILIISWLDYNHLINNTVYTVNCLLLLLQACGAILLLLISIIPASISSGWNWLFIPFNILPATVWIAAHHKPICRHFFIFYGITCAIFTFAPMWTDQASIWTSLVSISFRILSHYRSSLKAPTPLSATTNK